MSEFEKWWEENEWCCTSDKEACHNTFLAGQKSGLLKAVEIGEKRKLAVKPYFETMAAIHKAAKEVSDERINE